MPQKRAGVSTLRTTRVGAIVVDRALGGEDVYGAPPPYPVRWPLWNLFGTLAGARHQAHEIPSAYEVEAGESNRPVEDGGGRRSKLRGHLSRGRLPPSTLPYRQLVPEGQRESVRFEASTGRTVTPSDSMPARSR